MAEQAPDGGAPRTRAALAAYKAARTHTTNAELAQRAIVDAWEAEMGAGRILLAAMLEEGVLDRLDALEAERAAMLAVVGAAQHMYRQWEAYDHAAETEPYATSEWVEGEFINLEESLKVLGGALAAYQAAKGG